MLNSAPAQCRSCQRLQRRGGIVLPAVMSCTRLETGEAGEIMGRMLQVFAADDRCPEHSPYDSHPDCYFSQDLDPEVS